MAKSQKTQSSKKSGIPLWVSVLTVVFLVGVGVALLAISRGDTPAVDNTISRLPAAEQVARLTATGGTLDEQSDPGSAHVQAPPKYAVDPPSGGDHTAVPADAGVYTAGGVPPDGTVVHSMEHGFVVVWYRPDLHSDDLATLRKVFDAYPKDVLLVPRASLIKTNTPVAATAWHHRLLLPTVAADPLINFTALYRNQGPERIPH